MVSVTAFLPILEQSIQKLEKWIEDHDYKGYDPADGLTSYLRPLTFGNLFLDRLLTQLIWKSPFNLRPLLGVKPLESFIGRGYMARGYLTMFKITQKDEYKQKATTCLKWLKANKAPGYDHYCWGKLFDFASRGGMYRAFEPILIWTALIGHAFLDAYERLEERSYLEVAESICEWIVELPRNQADIGFCMGYHSHDKNGTIHNSNMVGAAFLARTAKHNGNREYLSVAKEAMKFSCSRQLPDGAWLYGEDPKNHWIDNFHTGYNLDALRCYMKETGDKTYKENLKIGFNFFKNHFFEASGRPKYYHNRAYPIDSQCASQAIETLAIFSEDDEEAQDLCIKVAKWTIEHMQDRTGYFYFRQYPFFTLKVPMIHWAQATTYKALTILILRME
jgi:rhamnogalacturonyl hydrolase YesR